MESLVRLAVMPSPRRNPLVRKLRGTALQLQCPARTLLPGIAVRSDYAPHRPCAGPHSICVFGNLPGIRAEGYARSHLTFLRLESLSV